MRVTADGVRGQIGHVSNGHARREHRDRARPQAFPSYFSILLTKASSVMTMVEVSSGVDAFAGCRGSVEVKTYRVRGFGLGGCCDPLAVARTAVRV
jgi:hypothetical protein